MTKHDCDVIVIGAGPAGSTAAALLAEKGRRVIVLDKHRFPRYHVGESLMPYCWFTLNRLGVVGRMDELGFTQKRSVQFVRADGQVSAPFYFVQHDDHPSSVTWQVWRSEFDQMLLANAEAKGAQVRQPHAARQLIEQDDRVVGVRVTDGDGEAYDLHAPITIDASGRDMFALTRNDWRVRDENLNRISLWTYYRGAMRDSGWDEGATTVAYLPNKGWFWYIPLRDDVVSVGIVGHKEYLYRDGVKNPAAVFAREIGENRWIADHLAPGEQFGQYWVTGDYSYRAKHCADNGLVLIGDAFAFLDPVFSSGVFLALKSGEMAADAVDEALAAGDVSAERFADYGRMLCQTIEGMRKLVYAFYDEGFSFGRLIRSHPELKRDLTDCLIGNLSKDMAALYAGLDELAATPAPSEHGRPRKRQAAIETHHA